MMKYTRRGIIGREWNRGGEDDLGEEDVDNGRALSAFHSTHAQRGKDFFTFRILVGWRRQGGGWVREPAIALMVIF